MDALYFKTYDRELVLQELGLHTDPSIEGGKFFDGKVFEMPNYLLVWIGKKAETVDPETGSVTKFHDGEFFNVWVRGQEMMDFFVDLRTASLLPVPSSPDLKLF